MTILMGDFNAKIGADNTGYNEVMGNQALCHMNKNSKRFADLCSLNQFVIGGSIFPHKQIHKTSWRSPDHVTENQIDHICINKMKKYNVSLLKTKEMRTAFHLSLSNRFNPLQNQLENTDTNIATYKLSGSEMWRNTCKEVLG